MKKRFFLTLILSSFIAAGCASTPLAQTYPMSYDQAYQASLDALDHVGDWKVLETDQLKGLIVLEKGGYFMPRQSAKVVVRRMAPFETSIDLGQAGSSRTQKSFLNAINRHVENRAASYPS